MSAGINPQRPKITAKCRCSFYGYIAGLMLRKVKSEYVFMWEDGQSNHTSVSSFIMYFQRPLSNRAFTPGMNCHEGPGKEQKEFAKMLFALHILHWCHLPVINIRQLYQSVKPARLRSCRRWASSCDLVPDGDTRNIWRSPRLPDVSVTFACKGKKRILWTICITKYIIHASLNLVATIHLPERAPNSWRWDSWSP